MAKTFEQAYQHAKLKVYSEADKSILFEAARQTIVNFEPITKPGNTNMKYNVQIAKRLKVKSIAGKNDKSTATMLGILDGFEDVDWETIDTAPGTLRAIGTKVGWNEEKDPDFGGKIYSQVIESQTEAIKATRAEDITKIYFDQLKATAKTLDLTKPLLPQITKEVYGLTMKVDDLQGMYDKKDLIGAIHPVLGTLIAAEIGKSYYNEPPVVAKGFGANRNIDGIGFQEESNLNKYEKSATERMGIVIAHNQAVAWRKDPIMKDIVKDLVLTKYKGLAFYDISTPLPPIKRSVMFVFDPASVSLAKTAGIND